MGSDSLAVVRSVLLSAKSVMKKVDARRGSHVELSIDDVGVANGLNVTIMPDKLNIFV